MAEQRGPASPLPEWGTGDTGQPDPRLVRPAGRAALLAALPDARVFAAVTATATGEELTDRRLRAESGAEMAVLLVESEGHRALPVFSSVAALHSWRGDARPVALSGSEACRAALEAGAVGVVLDPGAAAVVLERDDVVALADGFIPVPGSRVASRRAHVDLDAPREPVAEALVVALRAAVAPEALRAASLLQGEAGLVLGVVPRRALRPEELAALAQRVVQRLGPDLPATGLDLVQLRHPSGFPVLRRRRWPLRPGR